MAEKLMNQTPILITSYNRPDNLEQLLIQLDGFGFTKLFLFADGIEESFNTADIERSKNVHKIIKAYTSRNDDANLLLAKRNLGCYLGVKTALDWFFNYNKFGIVLEDDLRVSKGGLEFCSNVSLRFENNFSVGSISMYRASAYGYEDEGKSLLLSPFPTSWGWATWASRWNRFRDVISPLTKNPFNARYFAHGGLFGLRRWNKVLLDLESRSLDSWAYRWLFTHWLEGWGSIVLPTNQIENHGFDERATHTKRGSSEKITEGIPLRSEFWEVSDVSPKQKTTFLIDTYQVRTFNKRLRDLFT